MLGSKIIFVMNQIMLFRMIKGYWPHTIESLGNLIWKSEVATCIYRKCVWFFFKAADEGLPPPLQEDDNVADTKIRQSEALYDTLLAEEAAGQAKGEGEMDHQLSEEKRRQESEKLQDHLVCIQNLVIYSNQSVGDIF